MFSSVSSSLNERAMRVTSDESMSPDADKTLAQTRERERERETRIALESAQAPSLSLSLERSSALESFFSLERKRAWKRVLCEERCWYSFVSGFGPCLAFSRKSESSDALAASELPSSAPAMCISFETRISVLFLRNFVGLWTVPTTLVLGSPETLKDRPKLDTGI